MRADPIMAEPIVLNIANNIVQHALFAGDGSELAVPHPHQSAAKSADPKCAIVFWAKALNKITGQAVCPPKLPAFSAGVKAQPATGHAKPNGAIRALRNDPHI